MKKIVVKCKELKDPGIPPATLNKIEREFTYQIKKSKQNSKRKEARA